MEPPRGTRNLVSSATAHTQAGPAGQGPGMWGGHPPCCWGLRPGCPRLRSSLGPLPALRMAARVPLLSGVELRVSLSG